MRLLADENVSTRLVVALRQAGHDVSWIREGRSGTPDLGVLQEAIDSGRILLTYDKQFIAEIAAERPTGLSGAIFLRLPIGGSPQAIAKTLDLLENWHGIQASLTIVKRDGVRVRRLAELDD